MNHQTKTPHTKVEERVVLLVEGKEVAPISNQEVIPVKTFDGVDFSVISKKEGVEGLLEILESGDADLADYTLLKKKHAIQTDFFKHPDTKEWVLTEALRVAKDDGNFHGMTVTMANGGGYGYAACEDPLWNRLKEIKDDIAARMKAREALLKLIPEGGKEETIEAMPTLVIEGSGEMVRLNPPYRSGKQIVKFSEIKRK